MRYPSRNDAINSTVGADALIGPCRCFGFAKGSWIV